jgi:hypothetical protein
MLSYKKSIISAILMAGLFSGPAFSVDMGHGSKLSTYVEKNYFEKLEEERKEKDAPKNEEKREESFSNKLYDSTYQGVQLLCHGVRSISDLMRNDFKLNTEPAHDVLKTKYSEIDPQKKILNFVGNSMRCLSGMVTGESLRLERTIVNYWLYEDTGNEVETVLTTTTKFLLESGRIPNKEGVYDWYNRIVSAFYKRGQFSFVAPKVDHMALFAQGLIDGILTVPINRYLLERVKFLEEDIQKVKDHLKILKVDFEKMDRISSIDNEYLTKDELNQRIEQGEEQFMAERKEKKITKFITKRLKMTSKTIQLNSNYSSRRFESNMINNQNN